MEPLLKDYSKQSTKHGLKRGVLLVLRGSFTWKCEEKRFRKKKSGLKTGVAFHEGGLSSEVPLYQLINGTEMEHFSTICDETDVNQVGKTRN